ncbi:MAG: efflux transporter outer membrane subunit [Propionivibrio sp.]
MPRQLINTTRICLASAVLLAGCADLNGLAPQGQLRSQQTIAARESLAGVAPAPWPRSDWWRGLGDATLDTLIGEALRDNPDLAAADARVRLATAQAGSAESALYPTLDAKASLPGTPFPDDFPKPFAGYTSAKQANLTATYVFDLWGGQRAAWEAALGQQRAAEVDGEAARLTLSTRVAQAYGDLEYAFASHDIAIADLDRAQKLLDLTRQRVQAGIDSVALLRQAESTQASAEQKKAQTAQRIESVRTQLAVLLGQGPDRGLTIARPAALNAAELALPDDLPAELLGRRPDIVAARWRVEAARRGIDAAKAQFLPNINLTAVFGVMSLKGADLLDSTSRFGLVTPAISLPIFDGGRLRSNLAGRDADYDLAVAQYNKTLIGAFNEVADSLSQLRSLQTQLAAQQRALASAQQAWELSTQRYRNGVGGYLEVLVLQQALHLAEDRLAEIENRRIAASINLVRALGGGYRADAPAALPIVPVASADGHATAKEN